MAELRECVFFCLAKFELRIDQAKWSVLLRPFFALLTTDDSCFFVTDDRSVSFFFCCEGQHVGERPTARLQDMVPSTGVDASSGVSQTKC